MWFDRLQELGDEPHVRDEVREVSRSGVDAVQVTLGAAELRLDNWEAVPARCSTVVRESACGRGYGRVHERHGAAAAERDGRVGILFGLQDTSPIGPNLDRLEQLHALGVRVIQLTYNRRNLIGNGCTEREQSGLSRFGVDLVGAMNELGIVVDVSHSGYQTTIDAMEVSSRPIAFTHVACKAVNEHPRVKSDEQIRLLADSDGISE